MFTRLLSLRRSFCSVSSGLVYRQATAKEVDIFTRAAVREGRHVGPYDYPCAFAFDPKGFFVGEKDGELASQFCMISYPGSHSSIGGLVIQDKFRGRGYGLDSALKAIDVNEQGRTTGADIICDLKHTMENLGFEHCWDTYSAMFSLDKIVANLDKMTPSKHVAVKPIHSVQLEKVLEYDRSVFGTAREAFLKTWMTAPGHFGFAAIDEKSSNIVGYAIVRLIIRGAGTEIGLAVAPLYADSTHIVKLLLKTIAEHCLRIDTLSKTKLELFHPVGDQCGQGAPELMEELGAELRLYTYRMYTNGVPSGRQLRKIYGITTTFYD